MEWLRSADILYSTDFKFTVFKKSSFQTVLGGIFSICTIVFSVMITFYFGTDLYYRTNPDIVFNQVVPEKYRLFNVTNNNFILFFQFQDGLSNIKDLTNELHFHFFYIQQAINSEGHQELVSTSYVPIVKCKSFLGMINVAFTSYNIDEFLCLNLTQNSSQENYQIGGYFDGTFNNYLYMIISMCEIMTETGGGENCTDINEINKVLSSGGNETYITLYIQSAFLAEETLASPLRTDLNTYFQLLGPKTRKKENFMFQEMSLIDDTGIIFPKKQNYSTFTLKKQSLSYEDVEGNVTENFFASSLYEAGFYFDKNTAEYKRSFMKVQDLTAQVGGFVNAVFILFQMLVKIVSGIEIKKTIINNIFDLTQKVKDKDKFKRISMSKSKLEFSVVKQRDFSNPNANNSGELCDARIVNEKELEKNNSILLINDNKNDKSNAENYNPITVVHKRNINKKNELPQAVTIKLKEEEEKLTSEILFDVPYILVIQRLCCKRCINAKNQIILSKLEYGEQYIENKLDINFYLRLIINFHYLLKIIFTKEQRLIFHFAKKPTLKSGKRDKFAKLKTNENEIIGMIKNESNETDKKVLEHLDLGVLKEIISRSSYQNNDNSSYALLANLSKKNQGNDN